MQAGNEFTILLERNAILLDVDNGPDGLTRRVNDLLYERDGLHTAMAALRSGGILAVWSAEPDTASADRLHDVGFEVDEVIVREAANNEGAQHNLVCAQALIRRSGPQQAGGMSRICEYPVRHGERPPPQIVASVRIKLLSCSARSRLRATSKTWLAMDRHAFSDRSERSRTFSSRAPAAS